MSEIKDIAVSLLQFQSDTSLEWGVDLPSRTIQLLGEVNIDMFSFLDSALSLLEHQSREAVTLRINSFGGDVEQAFAIIGRMERSPCKIITEGYGYCASSACLILVAGDKRRLSKWAEVMFHEISYAVEGTHTQVEHQVKQLQREYRKWCEAMAQFTKSDSGKWLLEGRNGIDLYMNAGECLKLNIVDEVF